MRGGARSSWPGSRASCAKVATTLIDYVAERNAQHRRVGCVCARGAAAPELDRKVSVPTPDAAPSSLLLIHGAGSGPWVFDDWLGSFPSMRVAAVDLLEGLDVASASMSDYAERVVAAAPALPKPVALCGWSMGGLVALQAAACVRPHSVILIEASPPAEVQGFDAAVAVGAGTFD